ncbi:MAG: Zn-finger nucleic acid-binding protein [Candidatus Azotimanducaceae bacterium]|jgi:Zn-finger nucleic acid-binding protein
MSETYNLIFFPTITSGSEEEVKEKLSAMLKVDSAKVDEWFAAGKPTVLMKNVGHDVADRYMEAITSCGANCNIQPSGIASGMSLEPKPKDIEYFVCPSCQYDEELEPEMTYEQCPKCGLFIDKWEAKQLAEREKEEIRRRLLRDARIKGEGDDDSARKEDELARLRALERELMIELGIKPPSRFWNFYSTHPVSISTSIAALLVTASFASSFILNRYIEEEEKAELIAAAPIAIIQETAPMLAEVVSLKQNGNEPLVSELADVTASLRGSREQAQGVVKAAEQMMKGIGADAFIQTTMKSAGEKKLTLKAPGEPPQSSVNIDTIGGISGLAGVSSFSQSDLAQLAPSLGQHGKDAVLDLMSKSLSVKNPEDLGGPNIRVNKLSTLDGSSVINLLKSVSLDLEWDQYLLSHVVGYLNRGKSSLASDTTEYIKNPLIRIQAHTKTLEQKVLSNPNVDLQFYVSSIQTELAKITDINSRTELRLDLAKRLGDNGGATEPYDTIELMEKEFEKTADPFSKSVIAGHLAVIYVYLVDRARARELFSMATKSAGDIQDTAKRISAFTLIAQRYYDVRNATIANEILSEAQQLAATDLPSVKRSYVFGKIAFSQLYLGDLKGGLGSIRNASRGKARNQLIMQLGESLIKSDRTYLARKLLNEVDDAQLYHRLALKVSSALFYEGEEREAAGLLEMSKASLGNISSIAQRCLIKSQYARMFARFGQGSLSSTLFNETLQESNALAGRQLDVVKGLVALDQARSLDISNAKETLASLDAQFVKDSLGSEIVKTEWVIDRLARR